MTTEIALFDELKSELAELVAPTLGIKVTDALTGSSAIDAAKQVKALQKRIEDKRKALVGPLNDRVREINDYAKTIVAPLTEAEQHLKRELVAFETEQEKIRQAELRKAEEERKRREAELLAQQEEERRQLAAIQAEESEITDMFGDDPEAPTVDPVKLEQKQQEERAKLAQEAKVAEYDIKQSRGVKNARKIWKCEAVDLSLVPKEFLIIELNQAAVLAAARVGVTTIPGVRLWQETSIAIGANTYVPSLAGSFGQK